MKKLGRRSVFVIVVIVGIIAALSLFVSQKGLGLIAITPTPVPDKPIFVPEGGGHKEYEEPGSQEKHVLITIENGKLVPETVTVEVGSTIVFENEEKVDHALQSDESASKEASFNTGKLPYEKRVDAITYTKPGTYTYYCKIHPEMKGTIIVTE